MIAEIKYLLKDIQINLFVFKGDSIILLRMKSHPRNFYVFLYKEIHICFTV